MPINQQCFFNHTDGSFAKNRDLLIMEATHWQVIIHPLVELDDITPNIQGM